MSDCLFCKFIKGEIPTEKVYENESVFAFKDINPEAPVHSLFIHKTHTSDINEITKNNPKQINDIFKAITEYTEQTVELESGFRVVTNCGENAGQTIFHTHFHVLGGKRLGKLA